jgi:hypothetical protein
MLVRRLRAERKHSLTPSGDVYVHADRGRTVVDVVPGSFLRCKEVYPASRCCAASGPPETAEPKVESKRTRDAREVSL